MIGPRFAGQQGLDGGHEVVRHRAAQAAVGEFDDALLGTRFDAAGAQDVAVDADVAELVDDEGETPTVGLLEQVPDHGGLAGSEEAGDDRHGNLLQGAHAGGPFEFGGGGMRAITPFLRASGRSLQGISPSLVSA